MGAGNGRHGPRSRERLDHKQKESVGRLLAVDSECHIRWSEVESLEGGHRCERFKFCFADD